MLKKLEVDAVFKGKTMESLFSVKLITGNLIMTFSAKGKIKLLPFLFSLARFLYFCEICICSLKTTVILCNFFFLDRSKD